MTIKDPKPVVVGAISGLLVFAALTAWTYQQSFTIAQIAGDPAKFYGKQVSLTGIARSARSSTRHVDRQTVPTISFFLHETGDGRHGQGRRYVYVSVPSGLLANTLPADGQNMTISGVLKDPDQVGTIAP